MQMYNLISKYMDIHVKKCVILLIKGQVVRSLIFITAEINPINFGNT